jgi:hypothetical protein
MGQSQGVEGFVRYKPDYDYSDMYFTQNPPDLTPRALPGAAIYLIQYRTQQIELLNSKDILDSAESDSFGRYRLLSAPGKYYLAAAKRDFSTAVLQYNPQDSIGLNFPINAIILVHIPAGEIISHDFEIHELVPQ